MADVVFVHGLLNAPELYASLLDALAVQWEVHAPVAPGHIEPLGHPFKLREWVDALADELEAHKRPALIGHSAGGHVAMLAAAQSAAHVAGVVTLDSPPRTRRDLMSGDRAKQYLAEVLRDQPHLADVVHYIVRDDLDSIFEGFEEDLLNESFEFPILMVGADPSFGALVTPDLVSAARSKWSDVRSQTVEGFGHLLGVDTGDVRPVVGHIDTFLREVLNDV